MEILLQFISFCVVLFIYLHIRFHLKVGAEYEIYELSDPSKTKLEEICDIRQPVLFTHECTSLIANTTRAFIVSTYSMFDVKIRSVSTNPSSTEELYIPIPLHAMVQILKDDTKSVYFSESNADFLEETSIVKHIKQLDSFLRPPMVSNCNYDILMGSVGVATPFRYELNYRTFFLATQGTVHLKLSPPNSSRYLTPEYDYENFEFRSPVNPWDPQPKYSLEFSKIKCLDVVLPAGQIIYIPAYWWYSIKFVDPESSVTGLRYRTYMNNLAISPYISLHALQLQNVKWNIAERIKLKPAATLSTQHLLDESDETAALMYEMKEPLITPMVNQVNQSSEF
jgi:hypothetical protein